MVDMPPPFPFQISEIFHQPHKEHNTCTPYVAHCVCVCVCGGGCVANSEHLLWYHGDFESLSFLVLWGSLQFTACQTT